VCVCHDKINYCIYSLIGDGRERKCKNACDRISEEGGTLSEKSRCRANQTTPIEAKNFPGENQPENRAEEMFSFPAGFRRRGG